MKNLATYILEAQSEWEIKHDLINRLVKAGVGETSHLWLATMDELKDMARRAGVLDEAGISGIQPITPTSSMTDRTDKPQGDAQSGLCQTRPADPRRIRDPVRGPRPDASEARSPGSSRRRARIPAAVLTPGGAGCLTQQGAVRAGSARGQRGGSSGQWLARIHHRGTRRGRGAGVSRTRQGGAAEQWL